MRLKLRKIGNSLGVIIPREYIESYNEGDYIDLEEKEVITGTTGTQEDIQEEVITPAFENGTKRYK